jgi:hypothetical protein
MENLVRDNILDIRRRNLSLSTINCSCAALKHFFDINDFDLRWSKKLVKFKENRRDNINKNEIRGYLRRDSSNGKFCSGPTSKSYDIINV